MNLDALPYHDLTTMQSVDIRTVDPSTLVNIKDVNIDATLPFAQKAADYLRQVGNAYCFKCGDVIVKIKHSNTTTTINNCMEVYLRSL